MTGVPRVSWARGESQFHVSCKAADENRFCIGTEAVASSISLPMLGCLAFGLKVRPARLLRHPEPILGQIQLVGVLAGCGILGGPA